MHGNLTGNQLSEIAHRESPWLDWRKGIEPWERSQNHIANDAIRSNYSTHGFVTEHRKHSTRNG